MLIQGCNGVAQWSCSSSLSTTLTCSVSTDFASDICIDFVLDVLYRVKYFLCTAVIRLLEFVRLDLSRNCVSYILRCMCMKFIKLGIQSSESFCSQLLSLFCISSIVEASSFFLISHGIKATIHGFL